MTEGPETELPDQTRIRHLPFEMLVRINQEVVSLTGEKHAYTLDDEQGIRRMLATVEDSAIDKPRREAIIEKTSVLVYGISKGQFFHEGNKRTALAAGQMFLRGNGYTIEIKDADLVRVVDKAAVGQASLSEFEKVITRLIRDD